MKNKLSIPIILGTGRKGRQSENVAKFVFEEVKKIKDIEVKFFDARDYALDVTDASGNSDLAKQFSEKVNKADGIIIVSPEYNHTYPGELKMMLDMLYKEYHHKPMSFCGVSASPMGGARMVEQLRLVAVELHMVPTREAVYFSSVRNLFNEDGSIKDPEPYIPRIKKMMDELLWYAKALKEARST